MEAKIDIEKVRKGDHAAFKTFFECFYPKLMALACRFVDEQVAKDLVQEVFTSYWEQKKVIQPDNIQSFLFKWLQNSCLNHIKHQMIVDTKAPPKGDQHQAAPDRTLGSCLT